MTYFIIFVYILITKIVEVIFSGIIRGTDSYIKEQLSKMRANGINNLHYIKKNQLTPLLLDRIEIIIKEVFNIPDSIFSDSKTLKYTQSRILYVYYAKKTGFTYLEISKKINKHYKTTQYYKNKFNEYIQFDKLFIEKYIKIESKIDKIINGKV